MEHNEPLQNEADSTNFWLYILVSEACLLASLFCLAPWFASPGSIVGAILFLFLPIVYFSCLPGTFAGFGTHWIRWPIFALLPPLIGFLGGLAAGERGWEWIVFSSGMALTTAVVASGLRIWKGQLRKVHTVSADSDALQFRIRDLLIWTAVVAVLAGPIRLWLFEFLDSASSGLLLMVAAMAACLALIVVFNLWATLGHRVTIVKCIVLVITTLLLSMTSGFMVDILFFWLGLTTQVLFLLVLTPLRLYGVRFVKTID